MCLVSRLGYQLRSALLKIVLPQQSTAFIKKDPFLDPDVGARKLSYLSGAIVAPAPVALSMHLRHYNLMDSINDDGARTHRARLQCRV